MEGIVDRKCKRTCDTFSLFDWKITVEKFTGLTLLNECFSSENLEIEDSNDSITIGHKSSIVNYFCPTCVEKFTNDREMRDHYKTDEHLKMYRKARAGGIVATENITQSHYSGSSDDNSTSDSSSESEEENEIVEDDENAEMSATKYEEIPEDDKDEGAVASVATINEAILTLESFKEAARRHRIFFRNKVGEIIGLYRCLLFTKKDRPEDIHELNRRVNQVRQSRRWAVFLYSGGKFAGAIFDERSVVVHKTFARYTVRKKQGGSQSARDAQGNAPKSAGAALRRYCEMAIRKDIAELLNDTWRMEISLCKIILIWAPQSHRSVFFSTNQNASTPPGLTRDDPRLRRIPLPVRDITYAQVKALHAELSSYDVYDAHATLSLLQLAPRKQVRQLSESGDPVLQTTASGRLLLLEVDGGGPNSTKDAQTKSKSLAKEEKPLRELIAHEDDTETKPSQEEETAGEAKEVLENEADKGWRDRFLVAVACCDLVTCGVLLEEKESLGPGLASLLSQPIGGETSFSSYLHVAVEQGEAAVVRLLLEHGCDPCIRNFEGLTPYQKASKISNKVMTSVFRLFMFEFPDRYDYAAAQVPSALDPAREAEKKARDAERRKLLKKQRKEKDKEKRAEDRVREQEEEEKRRFLNLSDREKRAIAAERRLKSQAVETGREKVVLSRCYQCGCDITGRVPFEYMSFVFCTPTCLKQHRLTYGVKSRTSSVQS